MFLFSFLRSYNYDNSKAVNKILWVEFFDLFVRLQIIKWLFIDRPKKPTLNFQQLSIDIH